MAWPRLIFRLTAFCLFLLGTVLLALSLLAIDTVSRRRTDRTPWARRCFRWACGCLGLKVRIHGVEPERNALTVSNHISWSDIPILGSLTPVRFLSKSEVRDWPIIGWLAEQAGTLFIKRGGGRARRVRQAIAEQLHAGESVLVFPEGTTGAGHTVLPFHGLLLGAAAEAQVPIQPVSISYRREGQPDPIAPFIGDDAFHSHLVRLLKQPPACVDVLLHPVIHVTPETSTADLANRLWDTVRSGLARIQAGAFDGAEINDQHRAAPTSSIRTADAPAPSRLRSLPDDRQFQDQSTG